MSTTLQNNYTNKLQTTPTIVRHSEDGDLGDRAVPTFNPACSLVYGGQISVHVTWETSAAWHLFSGR